MSIDSTALAAVRSAGAAIHAAEAALDRARLRHRDAVRALHAAGATLREIAAALGLSHQRVHQLVTPAPDEVPLRPEPVEGRTAETGRSAPANAQGLEADGASDCRLCGDEDAGVVCASCRDSGRRLIAGEPVGDRRGLRLLFRHNRRSCAFCGRLPEAGERFVASIEAAVCPQCLDSP